MLRSALGMEIRLRSDGTLETAPAYKSGRWVPMEGSPFSWDPLLEFEGLGPCLLLPS